MLKGNKAIVTGGSRGIGYAIAKKLAEKGCRVVITGRDFETLKSVANELGGNVIPLLWDVLDLETVQTKMNEAIELLGGLAMYLLSKEAEMVCGETVVLDGAYAIR